MTKQEAGKELIAVVADILNPYNDHEVKIEAYLLAEEGWRKVPQAEWLEKYWRTEDDWGDYNHRSLTCSNCNKEFYNGEFTNYCPNCGAEIRKERNEERNYR